MRVARWWQFHFLHLQNIKINFAIPDQLHKNYLRGFVLTSLISSLSRTEARLIGCPAAVRPSRPSIFVRVIISSALKNHNASKNDSLQIHILRSFVEMKTVMSYLFSLVLLLIPIHLEVTIGSKPTILRKFQLNNFSGSCGPY